MKISLLAAVGTVCLFSASALHAQSEATTRTTRTNRASTVSRTTSTTITRNNLRRTLPQPTVTVAPRTDGVLPRAIRSGSPLQMINPFAPASYGGSSEVTRHEPADPYARSQGIKIATVDF